MDAANDSRSAGSRGCRSKVGGRPLAAREPGSRAGPGALTHPRPPQLAPPRPRDLNILTSALLPEQTSPTRCRPALCAPLSPTRSCPCMSRHLAEAGFPIRRNWSGSRRIIQFDSITPRPSVPSTFCPRAAAHITPNNIAVISKRTLTDVMWLVQASPSRIHDRSNTPTRGGYMYTRPYAMPPDWIFSL